MLSLERTLKREISVVGKEIVTHRQEVHSEKSKKLLTVDQLSMFKESAAKEIPKSLNKLKKDPLRDTYLRQCVGLLAGYLFTLSGHRKGVLVSLLEKEVLKCERSGDDYVIYAKSHNTAATYGRAKLALTKAEYTWLTDFAKLRPLLPGYSPEVPTFFFNSAGGEVEKMGDMVTDIWHKAGVPDVTIMTDIWHKAGVPDVTITLVRSSLSTLAQRRLEPCQRSKVTRSMCHSTSTSDKFYVGEESVSEAHATRSNLDKVVSPPSPLPAAKPKAKRKSKRMHIASSSDSDEPAPPKLPDVESRTSIWTDDLKKWHQKSICQCLAEGDHQGHDC
ncbi:uncharacterized protein LOC126407179 [Epinephelus moara]|uniref:uncharacterized protein LOC126407179 n=1 Tax=Epinephelus moara TaxID=300413 RepID=UPI00214EA7E8|nr:uncharacterized protein LOC126407179 [Epinephelus moara]